MKRRAAHACAVRDDGQGSLRGARGEYVEMRILCSSVVEPSSALQTVFELLSP